MLFQAFQHYIAGVRVAVLNDPSHDGQGIRRGPLRRRRSVKGGGMQIGALLASVSLRMSSEAPQPTPEADAGGEKILEKVTQVDDVSAVGAVCVRDLPSSTSNRRQMLAFIAKLVVGVVFDDGNPVTVSQITSCLRRSSVERYAGGILEVGEYVDKLWSGCAAPVQGRPCACSARQLQRLRIRRRKHSRPAARAQIRVAIRPGCGRRVDEDLP